jgi:hypothetical protein
MTWRLRSVIIDHNEEVVIATPTKCGKTSLESMVKREAKRGVGRLNGLVVVRPGQHRLDCPAEAEGYKRYMMVRNPWARLVSTWSFLANPKSKGEHKAKDIQQMTFGEFVYWWLQYRDAWSPVGVLQGGQQPSVFWSAPARWLMTLSECDAVWKAEDYIRVENMAGDLELLGLNYGQPVQNNSSSKVRPGEWTDYWTDELLRETASTLRKDAHAFGYDILLRISPGSLDYSNKTLEQLKEMV